MEENEIKKARLDAGLTQKGMEELLGIPWRTISNWETGERKPPEWAAKLIIAELGRLNKNTRIT